MHRELDLDAFLHAAPTIRTGKFRSEFLQFRLRCADDVPAAGLAQPGEIVCARHSAVGNPNSTQHAMARLHRGDDGLQRARVMRVAREHLVAERKTVKSDDNSNTYLLAIGPVIARIAALRLRVALGLALK